MRFLSFLFAVFFGSVATAQDVHTIWPGAPYAVDIQVPSGWGLTPNGPNRVMFLPISQPADSTTWCIAETQTNPGSAVMNIQQNWDARDANTGLFFENLARIVLAANLYDGDRVVAMENTDLGPDPEFGYRQRHSAAVQDANDTPAVYLSETSFHLSEGGLGLVFCAVRMGSGTTRPFDAEITGIFDGL